MGKFVDRTGERFGRLVVLTRLETGPATGGNRVRWQCQCDCGAVCEATGHALSNGEKQSCGCLRRERIAALRASHRKCRTPEHNSWRAARERCSNRNHDRYSIYGQRGISMDPRWDDFEVFLADMGPRPEGTSLDRIDVNGDYTPSNCRWATSSQQSANKRSVELYTWRGKERTITEISKMEGIPRTSLNKAVLRFRSIKPAVDYCKGRRFT